MANPKIVTITNDMTAEDVLAALQIKSVIVLVQDKKDHYKWYVAAKGVNRSTVTAYAKKQD